MPRKKRIDKKKPPIPDGLLEYLHTGDHTELGIEYYFLQEHGLLMWWEEIKSDILEVWKRQNPGRRPWAWWRWDAPRQTHDEWDGCFYNGNVPQPRIKVSGSGREAWQIRAECPEYELGIGTYIEVDVSDPPVVESEAHYLERHGLMTAAERRRIKDKDFEPVTLGPEDYLSIEEDQ